jgi:hypothetical protein
MATDRGYQVERLAVDLSLSEQRYSTGERRTAAIAN